MTECEVCTDLTVAGVPPVPCPNGPHSNTYTCPVCDDGYTFGDDGLPYHLARDVAEDDHDVCSPDDRHIPVPGSPC